jgi:hypothetical protein
MYSRERFLRNDFLGTTGQICNGVYIGQEPELAAFPSPAPSLLHRLPFSSACHSPAPTILQHLPFSSADLRPAKTYPSRSAQAGLEVPSESYPNA